MTDETKTPLQLQGIPAAPGMAAGNLFIWNEQILHLPTTYVTEDPAVAWEHIQNAIRSVQTELRALRQRTADRIGESEAGIFDAHAMIAEDPALAEMVQDLLGTGIPPETAWTEAVENFAEMLDSLPDDYLQARAADVRDVGRQVLAQLLGVSLAVQSLQSPAILIGRDFSPAQTAMIDPDLTLAFCTAEGGPTSHTAILAKSLGIPAIVGLGEAIYQLEQGAPALVDALEGKLTVYPTAAQADAFKRDRRAYDERSGADLQQAFLPAVTREGHRLEVAANIGNLADARQALRFGADGVGLFRTEFIFLNRNTVPSLDEQTAIYREVLEVLNGRPLVVRTIDIGGDKQVDYLGIKSEPNPFLGWRGIRMLSERPDLIEQQLSALFTAAAQAGKADLRLMFPMVSTMEEVQAGRKIFEDCLQSVRVHYPDADLACQVGIMIEVPAAALMAGHLAALVDFFSIGTNDLSQYTMAADRMNSRVAGLANAFAPPVLRLIFDTIQAGHAHGKWVGMCGEFAGEALAIPFLLGAGLDEFSMAPSAIPTAKRLIRSLDVSACRAAASHVLQLDTPRAVQEYLQAQFGSIISGSGL